MTVKFEDKINEIDLLLNQKRGFWNLESIAHVSYEDICQIIRTHIFIKFASWKQELPFIPWAATIINNQLINLKKRYYGKMAPPFRECVYDNGGNPCGECEDCADYAKWQKNKQSGYNLLLAESINKSFDNDPEGMPRMDLPSKDEPDYLSATDKLHILMLKGMAEEMSQIYRWIFIESRPDQYVAERLGLQGQPAGKRIRYRQIENIKKRLTIKAKGILANTDIFSND